MPSDQRYTRALKDLRDGLFSVHIWPMLAWQEIRQRYRRSLLGPFWLTISSAVMIAAMGPLYGRLFNQDVSAYLPFLAVGLVVWQLMASIINDASQVFISAEQYIKQIRMPFTIHVLRMIWRNAIVFAHNLVIVVAVLLVYLPAWRWTMLSAVAGVFAILLNAIWIAMLLGLVCARYRDIPLIVSNIVLVAFFLTPIMWNHGMLGRHQWAAQVNPFFHFLEVVRAPLLGADVPVLSWLVVACVTAAGFASTIAIFGRYRARIAYWI